MEGLEILEHIPRRAMAIGAHPDDVELGAGGTLATWSARGCDVTIVVCTGGGAGTADRSTDPSCVVALRRREQEAAAEEIGARRVVMLGLEDGGLEDTAELRGTVVGLIREHRPETILSHDPHVRGLHHRDHRVAGQVALDAVYPYARDHLHYPEQIAAGLEPHRVDRCLLWDSDDANAIVDVGEGVAAQARALRRHASQLPGITGDADPDEWLRERSRFAARGLAFADGELFRLLRAPR